MARRTPKRPEVLGTNESVSASFSSGQYEIIPSDQDAPNSFSRSYVDKNISNPRDNFGSLSESALNNSNGPSSVSNSRGRQTSTSISSENGRHPGKTSTCALYVIFCTVGFERAAYYSLLGNLASFLSIQLHWPPTTTSIAVLLFCGMTWISCFIGGTLGDCGFGRYGTISLGLLIYMFGFVSLPLLADLDDILGEHYGQSPYVVFWISVALLLISMGEGFFKSNASPFGADQVVKSDNKQLHHFFSIFYSFINIGSLVGFGPIIFLEDKSFFRGYLASVACISTAAVLFMLPRNFSHRSRQDTRDNILRNTYDIVRDALKGRQRTHNRSSIESSLVSDFEQVAPVHHWLDRASLRYGGSFPDMEVNEVKMLFNILPPFGFLIIYYMLYYQVSGTFLLQGIHMNTSVRGFSIPAAWLSLMNVVFVLFFIPIVDILVYPCLRICKFRISYLNRISFGMILGSVSLICAAIVERKRLNTHQYVNNTISGRVINATDLEIWYQVPQYSIAGISEVFVSVTGLEYAYTKAPKSMQSLATGLFFVSNGLGSFIGSLLIGLADVFGIKILKSGKGKHPALEGQLDYFFYALAAVNGLAWVFFVIYVRRRSKSKTGWKKRRRNLQKFLKRDENRTKASYGAVIREELPTD